MMELNLLTPSSEEWVTCVLENFDDFLIDHAAAEKKASGMALSMLSHYPDQPDIVKAMIDLSLEELTHFREVLKIMSERGLILAPDTKDEYVNNLRKHIRKGTDVYMMDRLLLGGIIEARGCERFSKIANALPAGELKSFYVAIAESESRHENLFIRLAQNHFNDEVIAQRLSELLQHEKGILSKLPIKPALH